VEYKHFLLRAFQREPGKWRASVKRIDGKPLMLVGSERAKLDKFVTGIDSSTPKDALLVAIAAIEAGTFSRRSGRAGRATAGDRSVRLRPGPRRRRHAKARNDDRL
jgi:hypothetical protein